MYTEIGCGGELVIPREYFTPHKNAHVRQVMEIIPESLTKDEAILEIEDVDPKIMNIPVSKIIDKGIISEYKENIIMSILSSSKE